MYNKKLPGHVIKKCYPCCSSNISALLKKKFVYCSAYKLFVIVLCIIFNYIVNATANTTSETLKTATYHLTSLNFLRQNGDMPVTYLSTLHMADAELQKELSEQMIYPFFSTLKTEKKSSITRESIHPHTLFKDLNSLTTLSERIGYINQNRTIQLTKFPVFSWLLKEYSLFYDEDKSVSASLNTITINGMLYDLLYRAENNNDAVAKLVLVFLNRSVKIALSEPTNPHSLLTRCKQYFSKFLFTKKAEKSFSEQLALLTSSPYTEEKYKQQKLLKLINAGYKYNKNYTFTSYEPDENGKNISDPSDHIALPVEQSQQLLNVDYPVLDNPDEKVNRTGAKFLDNYLTQITALATLSMFLVPAANAFTTPAIPSSQCTTNIVCGPHNTYSLGQYQFAQNLQRNPEGCFILGENITLHQHNEIYGLNNCKHPFSGEFNTGDYTLSLQSAARPLFGCIDQATIKGNFNFCTDNKTQTVPIISHRVLNKNTINIQQADNCETQRPVFDHIIGDNNQIIFSGNSNKIRVANGTGIVARQLSGSNNTITIMQGESHNSSTVFTTGGNYNTYYQQDMNMTRFTNSVLADNKLFTANYFTGNDTNIVQNNINATLFIKNTGIANQQTPDAQNTQPNIFSTNANINIRSIQDDNVRLTNISDNSLRRTRLKNNGRIEIRKNNGWQSVCEDTFDQKAAHAICKILGYKEAEIEGLRLSLKQKLPVNKLKSSPVHLNKQCTGYESDLHDCNTTTINSSACRQNEEAFLSCHDRIITHPAHPNLRLTDHTSNRIDRFDTTNTGIGRLELFSFDNPSTICSSLFSNSQVSAICDIIGFVKGQKLHSQSVPLSIKNRQIIASNLTQAEGGTLSINYYSGRHNCTDQSDLIIKCDPTEIKPINLYSNYRLADRHSTDEHRANTTSTGFGRLETLFNYPGGKVFISYCPENIDDNAVLILCNRLGFDSGSKSYLTAKPLPPVENFSSDNDGGRGLSIQCTNTCILTRGLLSKCSQPFTNVVISCKHNNSSIDSMDNIPPEPKNCFPYQIQIPTTTTTLFSGSYHTESCKFSSCPVKFWNINGVELSDTIRQQCGSKQRLDTTNREDWLSTWNMRCKSSSDLCNCHLPDEQLLGLVAEDIKYNEVLLVSRQTHPGNETANAQGLILVSKLFSNDIPQVLTPADGQLTTGILPINHVITEGHLIAIYPSEDNTSVNLFWSSLENSNNNYYTLSYDINGKPLVLTQDSVFIKDMNSPSITRHQINSTGDHTKNENIRFNLNQLSSDSILLPKSIEDAFTGTVKDGWLHLTATDDQNNGQIYVISYNLNEKSWNPDWEPVEGINSSNITKYSLFINNCNQKHFLSHGQIIATHPVLILIPKSGGCVSFSKVKEEAAPKPSSMSTELISGILPTTTGMTSEIPSTSIELTSKILPTTTGMTSDTPSIFTELTSETLSTSTGMIAETSSITPTTTQEVLSTSAELTSATPSVTLKVTPEPKDTDDVKPNNRLSIVSVITAVTTCTAVTAGCCLSYNRKKIKNYCCKPKKQNNNSTEQYADPDEEHIYDTIEDLHLNSIRNKKNSKP